MALSRAEEISRVREERLGSLWENLGLILRVNFIPFFFALRKTSETISMMSESLAMLTTLKKFTIVSSTDIHLYSS